MFPCSILQQAKENYRSKLGWSLGARILQMLDYTNGLVYKQPLHFSTLHSLEMGMALLIKAHTVLESLYSVILLVLIVACLIYGKAALPFLLTA